MLLILDVCVDAMASLKNDFRHDGAGVWQRTIVALRITNGREPSLLIIQSIVAFGGATAKGKLSLGFVMSNICSIFANRKSDFRFAETINKYMIMYGLFCRNEMRFVKNCDDE